MGQCTVFLEEQKTPSQLDHPAAYSCVACLGESFLSPLAVEIRFAHLKTHHRFERLRLRGLSGARDEFHLAAIVQNLKTVANRFWRPPSTMLAAYLA
jgi:hypothetical protein